jgi:hypothetical protein
VAAAAAAEKGSAMNQFIRRVADYVANEILIKGLANSRTFQKFAVRTNKQYEELQKKGTEQITQTLEELAKQNITGTKSASAAETLGSATSKGGDAAASSSSRLNPPQPPLRGIPGFFVAFAKEVRKDITGT